MLISTIWYRVPFKLITNLFKLRSFNVVLIKIVIAFQGSHEKYNCSVLLFNGYNRAFLHLYATYCGSGKIVMESFISRCKYPSLHLHIVSISKENISER